MNHHGARQVEYNAAAVALKPKERPLVTRITDYTRPPAGHVVIKVNCVAVNPIDWIIQDTDLFALNYPAVLGLDLAGEIFETGADVNSFRPGDRVIALGTAYSAKDTAYGAFQKYVVVPARAVSKLPMTISLEQGVVLPLSITTAAAGLFQREALGLDLPSFSNKRTPHGRTVVVWGGSSSVGSSAIQLAVASGYKVVAVAGKNNFGYVRNLGAQTCFDYHTVSVLDKIVHFLKGEMVVGAFHCAGGDSAVQSCANIVDRCKGKALVVTVKGVPSGGVPPTVRIKPINSASVWQNEVGPYIWNWLPQALEDESIIRPAPNALIVGNGLDSVQRAMDAQKAGVSAAKVVVTQIQNS